jgi:hypothetical protein
MEREKVDKDNLTKLTNGNSEFPKKHTTSQTGTTTTITHSSKTSQNSSSTEASSSNGRHEKSENSRSDRDKHGKEIIQKKIIAGCCRLYSVSL